MICKIIARRLQKLDLTPEYKEQFITALQTIEQKYTAQLLNKPLIIKKVCFRYLKICNQLISPSNIPTSIIALQFIKLLQLDIYQGKSYELYLIRITLHLLFVKCYDIKISSSHKHQLLTSKSKKHITTASTKSQSIQYMKKKSIYIERLKIFCAQIEQCYFYQYLQRDYYTNLEQVYFLVVKHQMQKIVDFREMYEATTEMVTAELLQVKQYLKKLFDLLKCHVMELNQMLFYLEKKVYEVLTVKVSFLIEVFVIQAVVHFVQEVAELLSDRQWKVYQKFISDGDNEIVFQNSEIGLKNATTTLGARSKMQVLSKFSNEDNSLLEEAGGNYNNVTYDSIKERFFNEQLELLWQKYGNIFSKIPNNVGQEDAFEKVEKIVDSFVERKYAKSDVVGDSDLRLSNNRGIKEMDEEGEDGDSQLGTQKLINRQQGGGRSQLWRDRNSFGDERTSRKRVTKYQMDKNEELEDFMNFVKEQRKDNFDRKEISYDVYNEVSKQKQKQKQTVRNLSRSLADFGNPNVYSTQKVIKGQQHQDDQVNEDDDNIDEQITANDSAIDAIITKPSPNDSIKRSNFGIIRDMNNVISYISQKSRHSSPIEHGYENNLKEKGNILCKHHHLHTQPNIMQNLTTSLTTSGFRKLNAVKTQNIKLLENIRQGEVQRLKRSKSTEMMAKTMGKMMDNRVGRQLELDLQEQGKKAKGRSQSLFFPFLKQPNNQLTRQQSQVLDMPRNELAGTGKLFIFSNAQQSNNNKMTKSREPLKIRSTSKKTTLDAMSMNRLKSGLSNQNNNEDSRGMFLEQISKFGGGSGNLREVETGGLLGMKGE